MNNIQTQIQEMIDRETQAWNAKDAEALVDLFHPDMVWPWPPDPKAHDPIHWIFPMGRFDRERWKKGWQELFDTHDLIHNHRQTVKIVVSEQGDGAFAVVDIDTLWRDAQGNDNHWKGRVCKGYTKIQSEWKLIMHTGVLDYHRMDKASGRSIPFGVIGKVVKALQSMLRPYRQSKMEKKMTKPEQAAEYMKRGYNCAQSVVKAFASDVGLDETDGIRMAAAFGGGMGRNGHVCGAVTGAALILGKKFGNAEPSDIEGREKAYAAVNRLLEAFEKEYGTVMCKALISVDMKDPDQLKKARESRIFQTQCPPYVFTAARILEEILAS